MTYGGDFIYPRFTCGSFGLALEQLFAAHTGRALHVEYFGKPLAATFRYAAAMAQHAAEQPIERFYM